MSKQHSPLTAALFLAAALAPAIPADAQTARLEPSRVVPGQALTVTVEGVWGSGVVPAFQQLTYDLAALWPNPAVWRVRFEGRAGGPAAETHYRQSFSFQPAFRAHMGGPQILEVYIGIGDLDSPDVLVASLPFEILEQEQALALLLHGDRFEVTATWKDFAGRTGEARALPGPSNVSGQLWFFSADNPELTVKVLDGCAVNGRYWVLVAGATNVEYHLLVRDTQTGRTWTSDNALGHFSQAGADNWTLICD